MPVFFCLNCTLFRLVKAVVLHSAVSNSGCCLAPDRQANESCQVRITKTRHFPNAKFMVLLSVQIPRHMFRPSHVPTDPNPNQSITRRTRRTQRRIDRHGKSCPCRQPTRDLCGARIVHRQSRYPGSMIHRWIFIQADLRPTFLYLREVCPIQSPIRNADWDFRPRMCSARLVATAM
ncbi:hypothetical protein QBC45DRAFT_413379 [Copromyces sp. CBS 386.78]|nr:hypothetical protein QBC45DRAFT_413379 [Copromyces sp. CBS 386.78]